MSLRVTYLQVKHFVELSTQTFVCVDVVLWVTTLVTVHTLDTQRDVSHKNYNLKVPCCGFALCNCQHRSDTYRPCRRFMFMIHFHNKYCFDNFTSSLFFARKPKININFADTTLLFYLARIHLNKNLNINKQFGVNEFKLEIFRWI
jgi:hypothetical protein